MVQEIVELLNQWTQNPGASKEAVEKVQSELGIVFPQDYVELMEWSNGGEGWVGESYLQLTPMEQIPWSNESVGALKYALGVIFIGGDGGAMIYGFDSRSDPPAIVEADAVSIGIPEDTMVHRMSFTEFLNLLHDRQYEDVYADINKEQKR